MPSDSWAPQPQDVPPTIPVARPVVPPPPASAGVRDLLIGVAIVWAVELVFGVGMGLAVGFRAAMTGDPVPTGLPPMWLLTLVIASNANALLVCWYFVCRKYRLRFAEGFAIVRLRPGGYVACVGIGLAAAVVATILMAHWAPGESFMAELAATPDGLTVLIIISLVVPPFEELYYRGFIYPILNKKLGPLWSVAIVTLWFGLVHSSQLAGDWIGIPIVTVMGLIWTLQRHYTRSLLASILTHWTYNAALILGGVVFG